MNNPIAIYQGPNPPEGVPSRADFKTLMRVVIAVQRWATDLTYTLQNQFNTIRTQLNSQVQGVGPNITSASSIAVSYPIHHITGTATITTITPPGGFSGPLWLIADGAFSISTGGNIALAAGPFTVKQSVELIYDPNTTLWYPNIG